MLTRRTALGLGLGALGLGTLAACGPNMPNSRGSAEGSLRLAWWGNPARNANTTAVIEAYREVDPAVTVSAEPGEWAGYWDKLATQTAGRDMPDILQMDEKYLAEYGTRGALLDLAEAGLDTSAFAPGTVEVGELPELGLMAITAGLNAVSIIANPTLFEQAGVELPDDTTWTWEQMLEVSRQITEATPDGVFGMSQIGGVQGVFQLWMRQLGQDQYTPSGVGFDAAAAREFLEFGRQVQETAAGPGASLAVEDTGKSVDQSLFGTGKAALTMVWSNQVVANDALVDGGVRVLRPPSMTGSAADVQLWYKASMYWSVAATSADPEAAVAFVDYLVNSPEAGAILSVERGVPANTEVLGSITPELDAANLKAVEYLEEVEGELGAPPTITPQGGGEFEAILTRVSQDVLFGTLDPAAGAERLVDELTAALA